MLLWGKSMKEYVGPIKQGKNKVGIMATEVVLANNGKRLC